MQPPPRFVLDGWSERIKVYPGICNSSSTLVVEESRYVSDKQIISYLWSMIYAFKRNNLVYPWADIMLRFQWQIKYIVCNYLKALDSFQHYHLTLIKGCKDILQCAHQYCGTEKTEHRILRWFSKRYPLIEIKRRRKRRIFMKNSQNYSWTNYLTYPNIMTPHSVNLK